MGGQYEEGMNSALQIVKRDRDWRDQACKALVLGMVAALGPADPVAASGRRRFSNYWFI